jgi:hypothetical protein
MGLLMVRGFCAVVGQGEGVPTVENQLVDDPQTGKFTWTIENFSKINMRKHYSETFTVGGYKWWVTSSTVAASFDDQVQGYLFSSLLFSVGSKLEDVKWEQFAVLAGGCCCFQKAIMWIISQYT